MFTLKIKVKMSRGLKALSKNTSTSCLTSFSLIRTKCLTTALEGEEQQRREEHDELNDGIKSILQIYPTCAGLMGERKNSKRSIGRQALFFSTFPTAHRRSKSTKDIFQALHSV